MPSDHTCPVCTAGAASGADLRMHLMVEHRKSELAKVLTEGVSQTDGREDTLTA